MNNLLRKIYKATISHTQLQRKYNSLKLEKDVLEEYIKNDLYDAFKKGLNQDEEVKRLKYENRYLRKKNKELKEKIK